MAQVFSLDGQVVVLTATAKPLTAENITKPLPSYPSSAPHEYLQLWQAPRGFAQVEQLYATPQHANLTTQTTSEESVINSTNFHTPLQAWNQTHLSSEWQAHLQQAELLILEEEQLLELVQQLQLLDARSLVYLQDWSNYVDQCLLFQLMPFMLTAKFPSHLYVPRIEQLRNFLDHTVPALQWHVNPLTVTRSQLYSEVEHLWNNADNEMRKHLEAVFTRKSIFDLEEQNKDAPAPSTFAFKLHIESLYDLQTLERANHALLGEELLRYRNQIAQGLNVGQGILGDFSQATREDLLRAGSEQLRSSWASIDATLNNWQNPNNIGDAHAVHGDAHTHALAAHINSTVPSARTNQSAQAAVTNQAAQLARDFYTAAQQLENWEYLALVKITTDDHRLLQAQQAWQKFSQSTLTNRLGLLPGQAPTQILVADKDPNRKHNSKAVQGSASAPANSATSANHVATPTVAKATATTNPATAGDATCNSPVANRADFSNLKVAPIDISLLQKANPELERKLVELHGFSVSHTDPSRKKKTTSELNADATLAQRNQHLQQRIEQQEAVRAGKNSDTVPTYRLADSRNHEWRVELTLFQPNQLQQQPTSQLAVANGTPSNTTYNSVSDFQALLQDQTQVEQIPEVWNVTAGLLAQSTEPQLRVHQLAYQYRQKLQQVEQTYQQQDAVFDLASSFLGTKDKIKDFFATQETPSTWEVFKGKQPLPELSPRLYRQLSKYDELPSVRQAIENLSNPTATTELTTSVTSNPYTQPLQSRTPVVNPTATETQPTATSTKETTQGATQKATQKTASEVARDATSEVSATPKAQPALAALLRSEELPLGMLLACQGDLRRLWTWDAHNQYDFKHYLDIEQPTSIVSDAPASVLQQIAPQELLARLRATGYPSLAQLLEQRASSATQVVPWSQLQQLKIADLANYSCLPHGNWNPAYYQALVGETYALDYRMLFSKSSNQLLAQATPSVYAQLISALGSNQRSNAEYQQAVANELWTSQGRFNLVSYALELVSLLLPHTNLVTVLPHRGVVARTARVHDTVQTQTQVTPNTPENSSAQGKLAQHNPHCYRWSYFQPQYVLQKPEQAKTKSRTKQATQQAQQVPLHFPTGEFVGELLRNYSKGLTLPSAITASLRAVSQGELAAYELSNIVQVGFLLLDQQKS